MSKAIGRFEPTPSRSPEECERHYTQVHMRMAQNLLRPMPSLRSYHVNRAVAQADVGGGWAQRPRAWRFVILRFEPGQALAFTDEQNEMVAQDHVNCLYRLRHCDVEEDVVIDRIHGQLALAKFLIEADRPAEVEPAVAWQSFESLAERVRSAMECGYGARALIVNRALSELECEPVDVEGQRPIGLLPETLRVGYIEAYFDHSRWGEECLGGLARDGSLRRPELTGVNLLRVEELAPIDKREGV
jgi:hypothetical protein